jgi:hypothetical protein
MKSSIVLLTILTRRAYTIIYFIDFYIDYLDLDNSVISKVSGIDVIRELL